MEKASGLMKQNPAQESWAKTKKLKTGARRVGGSVIQLFPKKDFFFFFWICMISNFHRPL